MIVFEEKFRDLIELMPPSENANGIFPVRYDWGSFDLLNKFLLLKESKSKYPLIWLVTNETEGDVTTKSALRKSRFVIATKSNNVDEFNLTQYRNDYQKVLIPVYENFLKLLSSSGVTTIVGNTYKYDLRPNFSVENNGKGLITIWNAIVFDADIRLDLANCVNKCIKF